MHGHRAGPCDGRHPAVSIRPAGLCCQRGRTCWFSGPSVVDESYICYITEKDAVRSRFSTFLGMQCFCYIMFDHVCSYTCDGIARDPHRLSDFLRGCQRLPKNVQRVMKIPREKEGGKTNIVCVCIYIYMASLRGLPRKKKMFLGLSPLLALLCT